LSLGLILGVVLAVVVCGMPGLAGLGWAQDQEGMEEMNEGYSSDEVPTGNYRYDPVGKRDPFSSPFNLADVRPSTVDPQTPLQRFELGQLTLKGVILNSQEPKALIEDSKGLGYVVRQGTLIGSQGGVVKTIEPQRIVVEEYEIDFYGKRQRKERELKLVAVGTAPEP
jgi:type IV pilus assembly protein PilP